MAKDKCPECPPPGAPGWMATFSDLMTLLLCFFVLLFSMSTVDAEKLKQVAESMSNLFKITVEGGAPSKQISLDTMAGNGLAQLPNAGTGIQESMSKEMIDSQAELQKMASDFMTYFAEQNVADSVKVEVNENEDNIKITFINKILFDLGKADLKQESLHVLDVVATELLKYPNHDIRIEGHTDNLPVGTAQFPSNLYLSAARAIAVAEYFIDQKGLSPYLIGTEGFGEYRPIVPNDSAENRALNRRVEMKIMGSLSSGSR